MRSQEPLGNRADCILDSLLAGVLAVDRTETITYLNAAAARTLALESEAVLGKSLVTVLGPATRTVLGLERVFAGEARVDRETEWSRANGESCLIGFSASPFRGPHGTITGAIIAFREIGGFLARQQERGHAEQLAAIGLLAAGLAHEVRNPLAGLRSTAQALTRRISHTDAQHEYLRRMLVEIDRIDALLRSFLRYARPLRPRLKPVALPDVIASVAALLQEQLTSAGVRLRTEFPRPDPHVVADPDQLQQVFLNLFLNSLQAMGHGGEIGVQTRFLEEARAWEVRVRDTGTGILPENVDQVFTPFFSTKREGSGLGLAIVQQIVREHRGEVTLESRPGQGTTVSVRLPAASLPTGH